MNLFENLQLMNESNISYSIVKKEIKELKDKLKNSDIVENFGQEEIRQLKDKYSWFDLQDLDQSERLKILRAIDSFEEWCMTYVKTEGKNGEELFALRREAQITLSHFTVDQIDYIKRGYEKFVKEIGDAYVDERESNASQIKNELAADCVENEIVTSEEFEDIWNAFEKLSKFNSHAHA